MSDTLAPPPPAVAVPPPAAPAAEVPPPTPVAPPAPAAPAPVAPTFANPYAARAAAPAPAAEAAPAAPPKPPAPTVTELHQTVAARDAALAELTAKASALHTTVASHAATQLAALPANVRAVVERRANGDPVAALSIIDTMREAGVLNAPAAPAPLPVGATTAPPPPSAAAPTVDPDGALLAQHEQLKKTAPTVASIFAQKNAAALQRARARVS